jgi:hypothetical protein
MSLNNLNFLLEKQNAIESYLGCCQTCSSCWEALTEASPRTYALEPDF